MKTFPYRWRNWVLILSIYSTAPLLPSMSTSYLGLKQMLDDPIDEEEVRAAIKALKNNKTPGLDGLPVSTFKMFLISLTTALFNRLLEQEVFLMYGVQDLSNPYTRRETGNPPAITEELPCFPL